MTNEQDYTPYKEIVLADKTQAQASTLDRCENMLGLVRENTEIFNRTIDLASQVTDVYAESQRLNAQVTIAQEMSKVQIANIAAKYMATRDVIEKTFAERNKALSHYYAVLDNAVKDGDRDLIINAMHQISSVVTTSPLADIKAFTEKLNDTSQPLLDW